MAQSWEKTLLAAGNLAEEAKAALQDAMYPQYRYHKDGSFRQDPAQKWPPAAVLGLLRNAELTVQQAEKTPGFSHPGVAARVRARIEQVRTALQAADRERRRGENLAAKLERTRKPGGSLSGTKEVNDAYRSATEAFEQADRLAFRAPHSARTYMELGESYADDLELELLEAPGLRYLGEAADSARRAAAWAVRQGERSDEEDRRWARKTQGQERRAANNLFDQNVKPVRFAGFGSSTPTHKAHYRLAAGSTRHAAYTAAQFAVSPKQSCGRALEKLLQAYESVGGAANELRAIHAEDQGYAAGEVEEMRQALSNATAAFSARCLVR